MVRASLYLPDGYIKANGATVLRADYPRLVNLADKHNLWTEDTANYPGLFGVGDGLTTFTVPNWIDRMAQFGTGIGNAISAGLPNIEGSAGQNGNAAWNDVRNNTGAFSYDGTLKKNTVYTESDSYIYIRSDKCLVFDASKSNPLYGNADTVQPPAIGVLPVIKY